MANPDRTVTSCEAALRVLENAGIENADNGTPLSRVEIARRIMESVWYALEISADKLTWQTPIPDDEDTWDSLDYQIQSDFASILVWPESLPETFGGVVLEVERQFCHHWKQTVTDCEENPRRCGTQAAFYGVRNILRAVRNDDKARWRPSTPVAEAIPEDMRAQFERRINEEYGIYLPSEFKVLGQYPYQRAWWAVWLAAMLAIVAARIPGGWLVGIIVAVTIAVTIGLLVLSRGILSDSLQTLGDIARHIVAEQVELRASLKQAVNLYSDDAGESNGD
jgi:hypothetical protein